MPSTVSVESGSGRGDIKDQKYDDIVDNQPLVSEFNDCNTSCVRQHNLTLLLYFFHRWSVQTVVLARDGVWLPSKSHKDVFIFQFHIEPKMVELDEKIFGAIGDTVGCRQQISALIVLEDGAVDRRDQFLGQADRTGDFKEKFADRNQGSCSRR
jgi:hypothetical protein